MPTPGGSSSTSKCSLVASARPKVQVSVGLSYCRKRCPGGGPSNLSVLQTSSVGGGEIVGVGVWVGRGVRVGRRVLVAVGVAEGLGVEVGAVGDGVQVGG